MELERDGLVSPIQEVPVIEGELVATIRELAGRGVGSKTIARTVGVARNTVRRYLREPIAPGAQVRPAARRLTDDARREARTLCEGCAGGNAVVVQRLLKERSTDVSVRTIERAVADIRRVRRAAELATVRVESVPGDQLQIDFGQKRVRIAGEWVRVFLLVAVLSYSRRLFVKAFLSERQDDWREGIAAAFTHFGGVPRTVLGDNARALVFGRVARRAPLSFTRRISRSVGTGMSSRAHAPRIVRGPRARPKQALNTSSAMASRSSTSSRSPRSSAIWPSGWSSPMSASMGRRMRRRSYASSATSAPPCGPCRSVPCHAASSDSAGAWPTMPWSTSIRCATAYVRDHVDVVVDEQAVRIFHGTLLVATHARSSEPFARVIDPAHYAGLWRVRPVDAPLGPPTLARLGRDLTEYAAVVAGGGQ